MKVLNNAITFVTAKVNEIVPQMTDAWPNVFLIKLNLVLGDKFNWKF